MKTSDHSRPTYQESMSSLYRQTSAEEEKPVLMEGINAGISRLPSSSNAVALTRSADPEPMQHRSEANVLLEG